MNIKERIDMIKAKKAQIEALLSAKEKEVEEEYQMVMELYNEVNERVEAIKTKQKTTEETLDKYDGLLAFLNDGAEITEEPVVEEPVVEEPSNKTEEPSNKTEEPSNKTEEPSNDSSENIDDLLKLIDSPNKEESLNKEEKKEVKPDGKWKVELGEEVNNLIDQIGAS